MELWLIRIRPSRSRSMSTLFSEGRCTPSRAARVPWPGRSAWHGSGPEWGTGTRMRRVRMPQWRHRLAAFRGELHGCFTIRADALFELADAVLCAEGW